MKSSILNIHTHTCSYSSLPCLDYYYYYYYSYCEITRFLFEQLREEVVKRGRTGRWLHIYFFKNLWAAPFPPPTICLTLVISAFLAGLQGAKDRGVCPKLGSSIVHLLVPLRKRKKKKKPLNIWWLFSHYAAHLPRLLRISPERRLPFFLVPEAPQMNWRQASWVRGDKMVAPEVWLSLKHSCISACTKVTSWVWSHRLRAHVAC